MKEKFTCPKCKAKISLKEILKFDKSHVTICSRCKTRLHPKNTKSWNWGFFIGLTGVIAPSKLILHYGGSFLMAMTAGFLTGFIAVAAVALYTYRNTEFVPES